MQCERAQEFFSDYLERTLDRPMTVALESHLGNCAACREEVEALQETLLALDAVPEVEPPWDGAWQVIRQIRAQDAERQEARRPWSISFGQWLRTLNPASAAMGAGLATFVLAGALLVPGVQHVIRNSFWGPAAKPSVEMPEVRATYNPQTEQVSLQIRPRSGLPGAAARLNVGAAEIPIADADDRDLSAGRAIEQPVILHQGGRQAEALWLTVSSQRPHTEFRYLVVVPLTQRADSQPVVVDNQPLDEALRQLAPYLGRPVVVSGVPASRVSLGENGATPGACLQKLADQVNARVIVEPEEYRLLPLQ
jgi:hypothetical protein